MAVNYQPVNVLKHKSDVAVGASATETVVIERIELSDQDSKHFQLTLVASAAVEQTGITWKLQHSFDDGNTWQDVDPGGTDATVTITSTSNADADVSTANDNITETSHPWQTGDAVYYKSSAGNVITGLTDDTIYYVIDEATNTFQLATTYANAIAGTAINLTQPSGSDTHYFTAVNSSLTLSIDNSTDEPNLPLLPVARVVASTGSNDVFTVRDAWHSRRV